MTSRRKIAANRVNAQASTGPKTTRGKTRAARNARRHGLSLSVVSDPALLERVELLAREIAGATSNNEICQLARRVAEAQIDLVRVRQVRHHYRPYQQSKLYVPRCRRPCPQDGGPICTKKWSVYAPSK
jgi:hypothetical protein